MLKLIRFVMVIVMISVTASTALAQDITPQHTDPNWQVTYWNNTSLTGPPVVQRTETDLNYNWGSGSPAPGVNSDQFSARWTRYIDVPPDTYQISVTADDGVRVWVDDQLIIDQWYEHAPMTFTAQKYLGAGHHLLRVEYFENFGGAVLQISWRQGSAPPPPPPAIYRWRGEYFNNKSLSGPPAVVRDDQEINFNWGTGSPAPGVIDYDGFSARWTRTADLPAGNYRFTMVVDDGARLFVNGHLLIDAWKDQAPRTYTGDIYLPGGAISLQMEYYENVSGAVARLYWEGGSVPPPPPPPPADFSGYVATRQLNVRSGPSLYYPVLGWFYWKQQLRLLGRNEAGNWLKVEGPYNFRGWVYAYYVQSNVPIYNLPVIY
ncbi:MAG: PA14 domain-containing protein [Anaerolineae bacterium]